MRIWTDAGHSGYEAEWTDFGDYDTTGKIDAVIATTTTFSEVASPDLGATLVTDDGVQRHCFQVRAVNANGGGVASEEMCSEGGNHPGKVVALKVAEVTAGTGNQVSVKFEWDCPEDLGLSTFFAHTDQGCSYDTANSVAKIQFQYKTKIGDAAEDATWTNAVTPDATIGMIERGTTVVFKVRAHDPDKTEDFAIGQDSSISFTPEAVPSAPTVLVKVTEVNGDLTLTWNAPVYDGGTAIEGYDVRQQTLSKGDDAAAWSEIDFGSTALTPEGNTTTLTAATLIEGLRRISVRAYNVARTAGNFEGAGAAVTLVLELPVPTAPLKPTLTAQETSVATGGDVVLEWDTPADGGRAILGYEYNSKAGEGATTYSEDGWEAVARASGGLQNTVTISGIADGDYDFTVRAYNSEGDGTQSDDVEVTIETPVPPVGPPTNLTATPGDAQVTLSWTVVAEATGYQYNLKEFGAADNDTWTAIPGTNTQATDTATITAGVDNGNKYVFKVRATTTDSSVFGTSSAEVEVLVGKSTAPLRPDSRVGRGHLGDPQLDRACK